VQSALAKGDLVVGLARGILDVQTKEVSEAPANKIWTHERCLAIRCDVRLKTQVEVAVKKCLERFGQLDVVVKSVPDLAEVDVVVVLGGEFWELVKNKQNLNCEHSLRRMYTERSM